MSAGPLVNPLAGSPLERLGHLRSRQDWVDGVLGKEETRFVPTQGARNLFDLKNTPRAALLRAPEVESLEVNRESFVLLGALNQQHFFSVPVEERPQG